MSTPAEVIERAADALDLAHSTPTPEALDDLHRALLTLAGAFEVTNPPDLPTVATWYALDAAAAVWDAARREEGMNAGHRDPVRYAPRLLPLEAAGHAVTTARAALGPDAPAWHPVTDGPRAQRRRADLEAGRLADLEAGRLADLDDLDADVAALIAEGTAARAQLAQLAEDPEHEAELARVHAATEPVLAWHLTNNMYPPVPATMLPAALEAITGVVAEDHDRPVRLPTGEHTTAGELVRVWRLEGFVDDSYPEGTDG